MQDVPHASEHVLPHPAEHDEQELVHPEHELVHSCVHTLLHDVQASVQPEQCTLHSLTQVESQFELHPSHLLMLIPP